MAKLVPVDHDPFAQQAGPRLVPVDHDPFQAEPGPYQQDSMLGFAAGLTPFGVGRNIYRAATNPMGELKRLDDYARSAADGLTFGFGDKMAAGADALAGGNYDESLAKRRQITQDALERGGGGAEGAALIGSMAGPAKLAKMGGTLMNIPKVGKYFGMAGDGAVLGGLNAYGHGDDITSGAAFGAAGGAAGQLVGGLASGLASKIAAFKRDPSQQAAAEISAVIQSLKGDPAKLKQEIADLGPDAMLIDALGERGGALARRSANINPDARELLEGSLQARAAEQNNRGASDLAALTGLDVAETPTVEFMKKEAYDKVRPQITEAYNAAKAAGYDLSLKDFEHIFQTPMGIDARKKALISIRNRAFDAPQPENAALLPKGQSIPFNKDKPNYEKSRRVVDDLVPPLGKRPRRPLDLLDYVIAKGGVRDFGGDLRAADFHKTRKGQLATRVNGGRDIDLMRESAAADGYMGDLYGTPSDAISKSTVGDFVELLKQNHSGSPVYSQNDALDLADWKQFKDQQGIRVNFRSIGRDVAEKMGRGADENQLREVITRVDRGQNIDDAIEEVKYADAMENGMAPQDVPSGLGGEKVKNFSNLELVDNAKRALDDITSSSFRSGLNDKGSQASVLAKALKKLGDEKVPEYAGARKLRQDAYRKDEAFDLGQILGRGRMDLDAPGKIKDVALENLDAVKKAFGSELIERLMNKKSTEGALSMFASPMFKKASKAVLGDDAASLEKSLAREKTFAKSLRTVSGNSTTARQLAEMLGGGVMGGAGAFATGQDLLTGGITGATLGLARRGGKALLSKLATEKTKAIAPEIAKLLLMRSIPVGPGKTKAEKLIEANKTLIARLLMAGGISASK